MAQLIPKAVHRLTEQTATGASQGTGLRIGWSNGKDGVISALKLRKNCPCASCRENRGEASHEKPLAAPRSARLNVISATADEETNLELVWPIGNYAIGVKWADGHDSGIYPYALLQALTEEEK